MRIKTIFIGLLLLGVGCNQSAQQDEQHDESDTTFLDNDQHAENPFVYVPTDAFWEYQFDTIIHDFKPVKLREVQADSLTAESIEAVINNTWPNVQIKYLETFGDTVYLEIPESTVLTQQMGTAGAQQFMVSTTYSFTELPNVRYVAFGFEEGDHAVPGVYHRGSWDNQ
ncbi:hypothetical protein FXV77_18025 [Sphingobacterium phlebotomi]|uniref:Uncharacterized protein n=1 Tax=Sphingobacterium phlebotomi TaxID=2605433 RepID=A0A5D4GZB3_9SPHI|nr:hypothetical protein [Sphingobacterium phlebotomi]TYR33353.1 hypothetical protein FXV77_18025 [Sphingobacterium phlebotomi]